MNPLAVIFLAVAVGVLPFALLLGGHQGLTAVGVASLSAAFIIQIVRPRPTVTVRVLIRHIRTRKANR